MRKTSSIVNVSLRFRHRFWQGLLTLTFLLSATLSNGQTGGAVGSADQGLAAATTQLKSMWPTVQNLMYAVMAIIGLLGAISVYSKWSNGDPDTRKAAGSWFGALIFAGLVVAVLGAVFNQS